MAVLFIEPGTDATFDLKFYSSVVGTVTSDSGQKQTGPRSLKFDSGAGAAVTNLQIPAAQLPAGNNGVLSFAVRPAALPTGTTFLVTVITGGVAFELDLLASGLLRFSGNGVAVGATGSTLATATWTHLAVCYQITSSTVNSLRLFVGTNGTPDITITNATLGTSASSNQISLGLSNLMGANMVLNIDDVYLDDTGTLANPGDIRVTAKRPGSLYEGGFDTAIGANPANRWTNVNERALAETNGWAQSATLQYGRPVSDVTTTGWTVFGGGPAQANRTGPEARGISGGAVFGGRFPQTSRTIAAARPAFGGRVIQSGPRTSYNAMWQGVSEATVDDDLSYVQRASTGTLEVKLNAIADPLVGADHTLSVRLQCTDGGGGAEKATLSLVQTTTIIASAPQITLTRGSYATVTYTLTSAEANAITDYTDLRLRLVVDTAAAGEHTRITQLFFQAPQALANCPNESYQLEDWTAGDVDLRGATLVGRTAWAWVKKTTSVTAGEGLWADGALTTSTFATTSALATVTDGLDKYPTADRGIGVRASSGDAVTSLYECGYLLAYLPVTTTRFYLRLINNLTVPTAGTKSAALPSGTLLDTSPLEQTLSLTRGLSETSLAWSTLGQTGAQSDYVGRFTSPGLNAVTIAANMWTITFVGVEGGANANAFLALSLYVWRHSTKAVVGYIYDSATALGTEWATTRAYQAATFSGASVTAADGDMLVLEVWQVATQGDTTASSESFYYDGGTGGSGTDAAPYLETPQVLTFGVGIAGSQSFLLRNQNASQSPTANQKSLVLPSGTLDVTANGTGNERLGLSPSGGVTQVGITWNSLAQTAQQSSYLARFTTPALLAQTINAGTWTIAFAASASSASAASKLALTLYVWRPSTNAVVGRIYDAVTGLGTAWQTTEAGIVATFTGTALAVLTGDLLVLELWQVAAQTAATAFSNSVFFEGGPVPTQGAATVNAGSTLTAPQSLNFQTYAQIGSRVFAPLIRERDDA